MWGWLRRTFGRSAPAAPAGAWHELPVDAEVIRDFRVRIVGVTFANDDGSSRQTAIRALHHGTPLRLFFEDRNPVDLNAVAVFGPAGQIGYLRSELAAEIRQDAADGGFAGLTAYSVNNDHIQEGRVYLGVVATIRKCRMPLAPPEPRVRRRRGRKTKPAAGV